MIKCLLTLIAISLVSLLFFVACGDVISENDDNEIATTQPQDFTTATQPLNIDSTRVPYWVERWDLDVNEEHNIEIRASERPFHSFDELAFRATDIVRVKALGEERVELINTWQPPPREHAYAPAQTVQGQDFYAFIPPEEERYRERYDIFTVYRFRVLEVFQGTLQPGQEIEVRRRGGQLDNFTLVNHNWNNDFTADDELVLFLRGGDRNPYMPSWVPNPEETLRRIQSMPMVFVGSRRSIYRMLPTDSEALGIMAQSVVMEGVNPNNDWVLTMDDLTRIAQAAR